MGINLEFAAVYLLQIGLLVHLFKTGRSRLWILPLIFAPMIGGVVYLLVEVLPGLAGGITGQKAARSLKAAIDPGGDVRRSAAAWEHSSNADNARRYARALIDAGQAAQAEEVLQQSMTGLFRTEPSLMLLRGQAQFAQGQHAEAAAQLRALREENPDFRSPEGHLLLARALMASGEEEQALEEFHDVASYFPGAEARYRLGAALRDAGWPDEARTVWEQLANDSRHAPSHYRNAQRQWLSQAARDLKALG